MHLPYSIVGFIAASVISPGLAAPASAPAEGIKARATAGCGKTHLLTGVTTYHSLTSSGRDRSYSVHLPSGYDKSKAYPTVIGFHGSSSIGLFFEVDTKMSESRFSANVCYLPHKKKKPPCPKRMKSLIVSYRKSWSTRMGSGLVNSHRAYIPSQRRRMRKINFRIGRMGRRKLFLRVGGRRPPVRH